jgi:hypothetical protein
MKGLLQQVLSAAGVTCCMGIADATDLLQPNTTPVLTLLVL